jgi:hypothetical protein
VEDKVLKEMFKRREELTLEIVDKVLPYEVYVRMVGARQELIRTIDVYARMRSLED